MRHTEEGRLGGLAQWNRSVYLGMTAPDPARLHDPDITASCFVSDVRHETVGVADNVIGLSVMYDVWQKLM